VRTVRAAATDVEEARFVAFSETIYGLLSSQSEI
jgi:hypothetical protein